VRPPRIGSGRNYHKVFFHFVGLKLGKKSGEGCVKTGFGILDEPEKDEATDL
jgi:hypothetical protein